ncbi:alpha-amylase family glycosyl hydrolase [Winogradskyella sp.]|uniref:alpha-amylase family glycosyl hydrolase n=1 Tax=Winogradskyella sp. TaxID=1883156 RepID=UPI00260502F6|nr:alpha-amylase family glycosyl hydrolase [Winogradskyella sp.]
MKKIIFLMAIFATGLTFAQNITVSPPTFNEDDEITLTLTGVTWDPTDVYLWAWYFDLNDDFVGNSPLTGDNFSNSPAAAEFTDQGNGTYTYTFTPTTFYNDTGIGRIGVLAKSQDGTSQTGDFTFEVGIFQLFLTNPTEDVTLVNSAGDMFNIMANTASQPANFELTANGNVVNTQNNITDYNFDYMVNESTDFVLTATEVSTNTTLSQSFTAIVSPTPAMLPVPAGAIDGANLDFPSNGDITFVLYGEGKEFVYLIGSFNNWEIDDMFTMNYDSTTNRHWITVNGLANTDTVLYQYLVEATIAVADPYSTLILDEFNDPFITSDTFPNIPAYPDGQTNNPVSWLRPNQADYDWQVDNFIPPAKEDLVIYELLLRDFDDNHSFDDVVARLDYLETLGVNAIELMPVNEFDGNISWGYNPAFHMALDKYYGSPEDFKAMIDACHERGIAVLVDVVYNQGTGQHPFYRMWNTSGGGTGGQASGDSPFFNPVATHSYSVFNDFNHQSPATQEYVEQTIKYWLEEFRLDGFRFDLTKGFTQNCLNNEACTNNYNQDRVDILKQYADACWDANDNALIIFEHLGFGGSRNEEIEWSNYRLAEGKGIMFWNKYTDPYNEATMGYTPSNFNDMDWQNIGLSAPMNIGYMESHDEERLMYKNIAFGNSNGGYDVTDLSTALERMKAAGAFFFTIPGPKMIWQFGELGYDVSIFECEDGTIPLPYGNDACRTGVKPDGWDYLTEADRTEVYDTWATILDFKQNLPIFKTDDFTIESQTTNGLKRIYLTDDDAIGTEISQVVILGNFGVTTQDIVPFFPEGGTWFNMISSEMIDVIDTSAPITLGPGEFLMYSNEAVLSTPEFESLQDFALYPNPSRTLFSIDTNVSNVKIYDLTGKMVKAFSGAFTRTDTFDISNLGSGMYIVKVENDNNQTMTTKLVKL